MLLCFVGLVIADTDTDTATFDVTVSPIVMIDIQPNSTNWTAYPGNTTSAVDFSLVNIGSKDIVNIYLSNTEPTSMPFGTSTATNWDAGNFLEISNDTGTTYYYANRIEFNESEWPDYLTLPDNTQAVGRFRIADNEYFWALVSTDSPVNCTNGTIYIGTTPHTPSDSGDTDLTDNGFPLQQGNEANQNYGFVDATIGGQGYCIVVNGTCDAVRLVKWNMGTVPYDNAGRCTNDGYVYTGTLSPGESFEI
ncbi:hypothetical protein DRJ04_09365, partial [Candidatus Aerophobetes bacterium]